MRNAFACIKRHRRITALPGTLSGEGNIQVFTGSFTSVAGPKDIGIARKRDKWSPLYFLHQNFFLYRYSTAFSVHGERPSAEYAKLRKESLENEFGHVLGTHSSKSISAFYHFGPFLALYRAAIITIHMLRLTITQFFVKDIQKRAIKFRKTLVYLGPFYVKLGQALSTRPDILPPIYCQELAKLQDQIPPFPTRDAIKSIETQLGSSIPQIFADISPEPIAAASLGQVYKAHLHSGELVAVKVQRPGVARSLTLDALLFNLIRGQLKRFAKARKDLLVAVNEMVRHMFDEIDYILEAKNAERFASLYGCLPIGITGKSKKANRVKVPKIYWEFTRKGVLTMEWIDAIKLTDEACLKKASLNRRKLIDQGLYCSLRQLLEVGFFHADPHPGNLVATYTGSIAYFDFGMMGDIPRHFRVGLIQVLVHFVNRDSLGLANDFLSLGFLPEGVDIQLVSDALQRSFGDGTRQSRDFQITAISEQASDSGQETPNNGEDTSNPLEWKSFDMRAVVGATEDLLQFILSQKGQRVRVFLLRDIIKAADVFLQDEVIGSFFNENPEARGSTVSEGHTMLLRVANGFQYLYQAVKLAPELWTAMLIRMALKPDFHRFMFDIISGLAMHSSHRLPDASWVCVSRLMHDWVK
ncbi:uncharacterized protein sll0005-like isoform X5 [Tripterygium wilfordii]|uniref:uncharacterized protein sll0005-like isoform X5 n=1 Tax=Tripterygium wilfordii TaxID=458696 RepID=UPI0018F832E1|nr:uncharacterized protein sll0005-like isoform X5 [Tripterygium wilfordii]